jgi:O-methyltransferase
MATAAPGRDAWAFDSFEGLPPPGPQDPERAHEWTGSLVASEAKVREAFRRFAPSTPLHVAKGWFQDSFPVALRQIDTVGLLHVDGDWYESVKLTLETFEPLVCAGGFVVIDDYGAWEGARAATDEYRSAQAIAAPLVEIDRTAKYWRKPAAA